MHSKKYIALMNAREWRDLRNGWLSEHPLCEECKKQGYTVAARCVHHITPVESGRTDAECRELAYSPTNLMSLCYRCHADIHRAERSHTTEAHKQRNQQRLQQWIERHAR